MYLDGLGQKVTSDLSRISPLRSFIDVSSFRSKQAADFRDAAAHLFVFHREMPSSRTLCMFAKLAEVPEDRNYSIFLTQDNLACDIKLISQ